MSLLPKNEKKVPKETPRNFVIFGGTMHGKTYFTEEFPNPINLNTDGNADMIETPSINISHERNSKGGITVSASELLTNIIDELQGTSHSYQTVVIDVIDDIITLFEQEIIEEAGVSSVGDIPYGKGHQTLEMMVRVLVMRLKELSAKKKLNIIYISRLNTIEENDVQTFIPSLKLKWLNIVNGNSDYTILCRKIGKKYIRKAESKRKNYKREMVDDKHILELLDTVSGAFDKSEKTSKDEQEKIVKEQEKQKELEQKAKKHEKEEPEAATKETPKRRPPKPVTK